MSVRLGQQHKSTLARSTGNASRGGSQRAGTGWALTLGPLISLEVGMATQGRAVLPQALGAQVGRCKYPYARPYLPGPQWVQVGQSGGLATPGEALGWGPAHLILVEGRTTCCASSTA